MARRPEHLLPAVRAGVGGVTLENTPADGLAVGIRVERLGMRDRVRAVRLAHEARPA